MLSDDLVCRLCSSSKSESKEDHGFKELGVRYLNQVLKLSSTSDKCIWKEEISVCDITKTFCKRLNVLEFSEKTARLFVI